MGASKAKSVTEVFYGFVDFMELRNLQESGQLYVLCYIFYNEQTKEDRNSLDNHCQETHETKVAVFKIQRNSTDY